MPVHSPLCLEIHPMVICEAGPELTLALETNSMLCPGLNALPKNVHQSIPGDIIPQFEFE